MKKLFAILPCYNEEENIGNLIEKWFKEKSKLQKENIELEIVIINDCSTDNTEQIVLHKAKKYNNVSILNHNVNKGLGGVINTAVNYFFQNGNSEDLLVIMDGDGTHLPKYVHKMIDKISEGNDCVIASRYEKDSSIVGLSKHRQLMSNLAKFYYSKVLKIPNVKDYTCGYRVYRYNIIKKLLEKFSNNPIKEKSFACMMELLYKIHLVGAKISEVGFELRYDNKLGKSKMNIFHTINRSLILSLKMKIKYSKIFSLKILIFLLLFSIFLSLGTNFSPVNKQLFNHDSGIFSYVAYAMQHGKILYSEIWDNKGPVLYFVYYLGLLINENYGVYLLELFSIFLSVLFCYKICYLITKKKLLAILGLIYVFSTWILTYDGGTYSESFALPLLFIGVYVLLKILVNNENSNYNILKLGILTGLIGLLRLNILAVFLGFFIAIGIDFLSKRKFKEIFRWLLNGIIGVLIVLIPIFVYLIINHNLNDCLNIVYLNVLTYFKHSSFTQRLYALLKMFLEFNKSGASILFLGFILINIRLLFKKYIKNIKYKTLIIGTILAIILNLYANSLSGASYMHYFITFLPIVAIVISMYIIYFDNIRSKLKNLKIIIGTIMLFLCFNCYIGYFYDLVAINHKNFAIQKFDNCLISMTKENDLVQVIGSRRIDVSTNFRIKRLAASKYQYLPYWEFFAQKAKRNITNEMAKELYLKKPKLILFNILDEKQFYAFVDNERWANFIKVNYDLDNQLTKFNYKLFVRKY